MFPLTLSYFIIICGRRNHAHEKSHKTRSGKWSKQEAGTDITEIIDNPMNWYGHIKNALEHPYNIELTADGKKGKTMNKSFITETD